MAWRLVRMLAPTSMLACQEVTWLQCRMLWPSMCRHALDFMDMLPGSAEAFARSRNNGWLLWVILLAGLEAAVEAVVGPVLREVYR